MRRLLVLEINEIPLRILRWHAENAPNSATARLLARAQVGQSDADEPLPRDLYPSQSWASQAMGVPFSEHGVFWYGDPKPAQFPLYWQAAVRAGLSIGFMGTLHSSPLSRQLPAGDVRFAVPDPFASDADTIPARMSPLQRINLDMTQANSRVVADTSPILSYLKLAGALTRTGVSPSTVVEAGNLALSVARRQVPKERLRSGQFHLMADQFTRLAKKFDPDLSILFTNHIASAMHRYWYASFPEDWDEPMYDDAWVQRFQGEVPYAMRALDHWLERLMSWVEDTDRSMLILSSMGQIGGCPVESAETDAMIVRDHEKFARAIGVDHPFTVGKAMVPQITYQFDSDAIAAEVAAVVGDPNPALHIDRSGSAVTVTYSILRPESQKVELGGSWHTVEEAGLKFVEVGEQRVAVHHPLGALIVYNSPTALIGEEPVNYLTVAPAILQSLGVEPLAHHQTPGLTL